MFPQLAIAANEQPTETEGLIPLNIFTEEVDPDFPNSWIIRTPWIDIAFGVDPPLLFVDAHDIIPPVVIPIPTTYPLTLTMKFGGAIGLSTGDGLMLTATQEVLVNDVPSIIPEEIKGNAYLSGTMVSKIPYNVAGRNTKKEEERAQTATCCYCCDGTEY